MENEKTVFISHNHDRDRDFAKRLKDDLEKAPTVSAWMSSPSSIIQGAMWLQDVQNQLLKCTHFLVLLTPEALSRHWVLREMDAALHLEHEKAIKVTSYELEKCTMPPLWAIQQRIQFGVSYKDALSFLSDWLEVREFQPSVVKDEARTWSPSGTGRLLLPEGIGTTGVEATAQNLSLGDGRFEERVGSVERYYPRLGVAGLTLMRGLAKSDVVHFRGDKTDVYQVVKSIQKDREPVESAPSGSDIGLEIEEVVRVGDLVFKISDEEGAAKIRARLQSEPPIVGKVVQYFDAIGVASVHLRRALSKGDKIRVVGKDSEFSQRIEIIRWKRESVDRAPPGSKVGLAVDQPVSSGDVIFGCCQSKLS